MTTVLFTQKNSIYNKLKCDCWDMDRDARLYNGKKAVIAHSPCRAWGKLKGLAKPRPDEKELALFAVNVIRINGGVLEHPHGSSLWKEARLPKPGLIDEFGGFTLSINQHWFGHKAQKKTLLYIVGCTPSEIPDYHLNFDRIDYIVSTTSQKGNRKELSKKLREATPEPFAKWLITLVKTIEKNKKHKHHENTNSTQRKN